MEEWTRFHQAASMLPEDEREVFGLKWYDGLTLEQVAQEIGISLRTVKRRWHSAQALLDNALGEERPS